MSSALLRLVRATQPRVWPHSRPCLQRGLRYSLSLRSSLAPEPPSQEELDYDEELAAREEEDELADENEKESEGSSEDSGNKSSAPSDTSYNQWLKSPETQELKYAFPKNWLGETVPFPLNGSFVPPPPISDAQRDEMYRLYMADPETNSIRALSQKFHVSLGRVDAILRLKGMQHAWVKKNQLQTGFVRGMERLLGVPKFSQSVPEPFIDEEEEWDEAEDGEEGRELTLEEMRRNVHDADLSEEIQQNDPARQRYQRMYWESLPEFGGEPIVPASVERSRKAAKYFAAKDLQARNRKYLPSIPDTDTIKTPKEPIQISLKDSRPDIHFIDVGTKFLDVPSETKRLARIESRTRLRVKKATKKQTLSA